MKKKVGSGSPTASGACFDTLEQTMSWRRRFGNLFRSRRVEREIDEELSFHIEELTDALMASGLDETAARREALRRFGNYEANRERTRDMNTIEWVESSSRDIWLAARNLWRHKTFTIVALVILVMGIGANTATFTMLSAILWRPVPVHAPDELVVFGTNNARGIQAPRDPVEWSDRLFSYPVYEELRDDNEVFESLAAISAIDADMFVRRPGSSDLAPPDSVSARVVSGNYFRTLGVTAFAGRTIEPDDDENRDAHPVVVLSHGYWQRRLGSDPAVVGSQLSISGRIFDVIGIAPPGFRGESLGTSPDLYIPLMMYETAFNIWRLDIPCCQLLILIGRLADGVSREAAEGAMTLQFQRLIAAHAGDELSPDRRRRLESHRITLLAGQAGLSSLGSDYGRPLQLLMAAVGFVLVITCANLANLLLGRGSARAREIAIRTALGAGRPRLIRQLFTENLLLASLAGMLAVPVAIVIVRVLARMIFPDGPLPIDVGIDANVWAFTIGLSIAAAALFGVVPALHATSGRLGRDLHAAGRDGTIDGGRRSTLKNALAIGQVALSLVLLTCAGVFVSNVSNLRRIDLGYDVDDLHAIRLDIRSAGVSYLEPERLIALERELLARIRRLPNVENASFSMFRLLDPSGRWIDRVTVDGYTTADAESPMTEILPVTPGYFETARMPIQRGRAIQDSDGRNGERVVVVNQAFADRYFSGSDPLDRRLETQGETWRIVGVVSNARYNEPRQALEPRIFLPEYQDAGGPSQLLIRSASDTQSLTMSVRRVLSEVNPDLVIMNATSLDEQLDRVLSEERLLANLTSAFGMLALVLAAVGLFGVMNYNVAARTREIGLRMALGARRQTVMRMILREAYKLIALGAAGGLVVAYAVTQLASRLLADGFLYGVSPTDPIVMGLATFLLILVATAAVYWPVRRAAKVEPMVSLRHS